MSRWNIDSIWPICIGFGGCKKRTEKPRSRCPQCHDKWQRSYDMFDSSGTGMWTYSTTTGSTSTYRWGDLW